MTSPLSRRHLLRGCSGVLGFVLAGCAGGDEPPESTPVDDRGGEDTLADRPCPPIETGRDRVVCSHTGLPEDAPVFLTASPERTTLDGASPSARIELGLHNRSTEPLSFNPHSWRGWYDPGDGWQGLDRQRSGDGTTTVVPGESHSWSLVEAVESIRSDPTFEPGTYALSIGVPYPDARSQWVACLALVRLVHPDGH